MLILCDAMLRLYIRESVYRIMRKVKFVSESQNERCVIENDK